MIIGCLPTPAPKQPWLLPPGSGGSFMMRPGAAVVPPAPRKLLAAERNRNWPLTAAEAADAREASARELRWLKADSSQLERGL
jgi:hypothetical protein